MENHEKEKRGKVAELMYELLDFGRLEQLARDIWDKAPEAMKAEVATMFAEKVKAEIRRQVDWSEPKDRNHGDYKPPKPLMQQAFENVANEAVKKYMALHAEEIQAKLIASAEKEMASVLEKEGSYLFQQVLRKARDGFTKALDSRSW